MGGVGHACGQIIEHRIAVHDAGERIGARLDTQRLFGLLARGDVLHGAGDAGGIDIAGLGFADHAHPERMSIAALALQLQFEGYLPVDHIQQRLLQQRAIIQAQALQQLGHVAHRQVLAEDAGRLVGEVQALQAAVPLPAADVRQRLRAVEQGVVALELGDVAEQPEYVVRRIAPVAVYRHVRGGDPDHPSARAVVEADDGAAHDAPGLQ